MRLKLSYLGLMRQSFVQLRCCVVMEVSLGEVGNWGANESLYLLVVCS
jgi:hypothetical protein